MSGQLPPPPPPPSNWPPPPPPPSSWPPAPPPGGGPVPARSVTGWRAWSGRKKGLVFGGLALLVLLVAGALAGPRRAPTTAIASPTPTPGATVPPNAPPTATQTAPATLAPTATAAPATSTPASTIGKYEQTWLKAYGDTTCADWVNEMDAHQQFVMAADMLLTLQRADVPSAPIPPDEQIDRFASAITTSCEGPGAELGVKITEVAASLYTLSDDLKPGG
jgi:hypothetical protein